MANVEESRDILRTVARALDAGRAADAVHQFTQALSHDSSLKQVDLPPALTKSLGAERTAALIAAFAEHSCMVCKRGLLLCEECAGKGHVGDNRVCDLCVGLGTANCDFCSGSGWITYNYVPEGLRAAVVLARSKLALAEGQELLKTPIPNPGERSASGGRKQLAQQLLRLNRILGVFNNALGVAQNPPGAGPAAAETLKKVEAACSKAAQRMIRRVRQLLSLLAEASLAEAERATDSSKRELAERRATFYEALANSADFIGTGLYHVYLRDQGQKQQSPQPASPPPSESAQPPSPAPPPPEAAG